MIDEAEGLIKLSSQEEIDMWHDWKKNPDSVEKWRKLYGTFKPVIMTAMQKNLYGSNVPKGVHFAHAVGNFDTAIKTYDPKAGTKLSSWIHTNVQEKGKRINAKYSNIGFIPEARYFKVLTFKNAVEQLTDDLMREPSATEIADHLGWSIKQVETMRRELRADLLEDEDIQHQTVIVPDTTQSAIEYTYHELTPQQQVVYEHMFGSHGKKPMVDKHGQIDILGISRATKIPEAQVRNIKSRITAKIKSLV
jgi:DNA-directed RNA polymerase sigma subunit (sigma70/sigma32)